MHVYHMKSSISAACEDFNLLCIKDGFRPELIVTSVLTCLIIRPVRTKD